MSASCVDGDRVITCSAFHLGKMSVRPCKIQGKTITFMSDTSNLDYCVTLLVCLFWSPPPPFLILLAQTVLGGWGTQTHKLFWRVLWYEVASFFMVLNDTDGLMSGCFSKSLSVKFLCVTDSASRIRSSVLYLLLKWFNKTIRIEETGKQRVTVLVLIHIPQGGLLSFLLGNHHRNWECVA